MPRPKKKFVLDVKDGQKYINVGDTTILLLFVELSEYFWIMRERWEGGKSRRK